MYGLFGANLTEMFFFHVLSFVQLETKFHLRWYSRRNAYVYMGSYVCTYDDCIYVYTPFGVLGLGTNKRTK